MPEDRFRYDQYVDEALRGVARRVLRDIARDGLTGNHHFYISFRTGAPGVDIPEYLRSRYPEEITIVLQHQFWGLEVEEKLFTVTVSFNKQNERLVVPFAALTAFVDPSVRFGLQFEDAKSDAKSDANAERGGQLGAPVGAPIGIAGATPLGAPNAIPGPGAGRSANKSAGSKLLGSSRESSRDPARPAGPQAKDGDARQATDSDATAETAGSGTGPGTGPGTGKNDAAASKVVTLDAFRKK